MFAYSHSKPRKEKITLNEWKEYKKLAKQVEEEENPDKSTVIKKKRLEQKIVEAYQDIPVAQAYKYKRTKPTILDLNDLIAAGRMGLYQAMSRYTPTDKVQFNTFATFRIRGAILDQINAVDWTPRSVRERIKKVLKVINQLEIEKQESSVMNGELAQEIANKIDNDDMDVKEIRIVLKQLEKTYFSHMDQEALNSFNPSSNTDVSGKQHNAVLSERLKMIMGLTLNAQEKELIQQKFFYGYKDYEIRENLHISQNELSRIETEALKKMSENIDPNDEIYSL